VGIGCKSYVMGFSGGEDGGGGYELYVMGLSGRERWV
jgi:hypothetical protein